MPRTCTKNIRSPRNIRNSLLRARRRHAGFALWTKCLSLLLSLSFIFPYLTWAFEPENFPNPPAAEFTPPHKPITIPSEYGIITQSFRGGDRRVVVIQDLHCNFEVQMNIAGILDHLADTQGLRLVGIEGASQPLNVSKLGSFPVPEVKRQVGRYLVRRGEIGGPEYYAATGRHPIRVKGIETRKLYQQSLAEVRSFLNPENQGICYDLREAYEELKGRWYTPALGSLDQLQSRYRQGQLGLRAYVLALQREARKFGAELADAPEMQAILQGAQANLPPSGDREKLDSELDAWVAALRETLYTREEQRSLDLYLGRLDVLEKLMHISASPAEVSAFCAHRPDYAATAFLQGLRQLSPAGTEAQDLEPEILQLDACLERVADFYRLADERSGQCAANLLDRMRRDGADLAVLVAGGFHAAGIQKTLENAGVSYLGVQPRVTDFETDSPYFQLLQNRVTPLEKLLTARQNLLAIPVSSVEVREDAGTQDTAAAILNEDNLEQLAGTQDRQTLQRYRAHLNFIQVLLNGCLVDWLAGQGAGARLFLKYFSLKQDYPADYSGLEFNAAKATSETLKQLAAGQPAVLQLADAGVPFTLVLSPAADSGREAAALASMPLEDGRKLWVMNPAQVEAYRRQWQAASGPGRLLREVTVRMPRSLAVVFAVHLLGRLALAGLALQARGRSIWAGLKTAGPGAAWAGLANTVVNFLTVSGLALRLARLWPTPGRAPSLSGGARKPLMEPHRPLRSSESAALLRLARSRPWPAVENKQINLPGGQPLTLPSYRLVAYTATGRDDPMDLLLARKGNAYHLRDPQSGEQFIFVNQAAMDREEAVEHEEFDLFWTVRLEAEASSPEGLRLPAGFDIQRAAHTLAWGLQIALRGWTRVGQSAFLRHELFFLGESDLRSLARENRRPHAQLRERYLTPLLPPQTLQTIADFETSIRDAYAANDPRDLRNYRQVRKILAQGIRGEIRAMLRGEREEYAADYFLEAMPFLALDDGEEVITLHRLADELYPEILAQFKTDFAKAAKKLARAEYGQAVVADLPTSEQLFALLQVRNEYQFVLIQGAAGRFLLICKGTGELPDALVELTGAGAVVPEVFGLLPLGPYLEAVGHSHPRAAGPSPRDQDNQQSLSETLRDMDLDPSRVGRFVVRIDPRLGHWWLWRFDADTGAYVRHEGQAEVREQLADLGFIQRPLAPAGDDREGVIGAMLEGHRGLYAEMVERVGKIAARRGWGGIFSGLERARTPQDRQAIDRALARLRQAGLPEERIERMRARVFPVTVAESKLGREGSRLGGLIVRHAGEYHVLFPRERLLNPDPEVLGDLLHELVEIELLENGFTLAEAHWQALRLRRLWLEGGEAPGPAVAQAWEELRNPYRWGQFELAFPGILRGILDGRNVSSRTNLATLPEDRLAGIRREFLAALHAAGWHAPPEVQERYENIVHHLLTAAQLRQLTQALGPVTERDLAWVLQRLHTFAVRLDEFGVQPEVAVQLRLLDLLNQLPFSEAQRVQLLATHGLAGPQWDGAVPDAAVTQALRAGKLDEAWERVFGQSRPIAEALPFLKALVEFFRVSLSRMENNYFINLLLDFQNTTGRPLERGTADERRRAAGELTRNTVDGLWIALEVGHYLADRGIRMERFLARGFDGIVFEGRLRGRPVVIKINLPQNGLKPRELLENINHVMSATDGRPDFVQNQELLLIRTVRDQEIVIEVNARVPGIPLWRLLHHPEAYGVGAAAVLDHLRQFLDMHAFLARHGLVNRDAQNLNNIVTRPDGRDQFVDFGNIRPRQPGEETWERRQVLLAMIKILTGQAIRLAESQEGDQGTDIGREQYIALFLKRFGEQHRELAAEIFTLWADAWENPEKPWEELSQSLGELSGRLGESERLASGIVGAALVEGGGPAAPLGLAAAESTRGLRATAETRPTAAPLPGDESLAGGIGIPGAKLPRNILARQAAVAALGYGALAAGLAGVLAALGVGDPQANLAVVASVAGFLSGRAALAGLAEWFIKGRVLRNGPGLIYVTDGRLVIDRRVQVTSFPRRVLAYTAGYICLGLLAVSSLVHEFFHYFLPSETAVYGLEALTVMTVAGFFLNALWITAAGALAVGAVLLVRVGREIRAAMAGTASLAAAPETAETDTETNAATPASFLLEAMGLGRVDQIPGATRLPLSAADESVFATAGLQVARIRLDQQPSSAVLPEGVEILRRELLIRGQQTSVFDLLLSSDGARILAAFPAGDGKQSAPPSAKTGWDYVDFTPYYLSLPNPAGRAAEEAWKNFGFEWERTQALVQAYKNVRFGPAAARLVHAINPRESYVSVAVSRLTGKVTVRPLYIKMGSLPRPRPWTRQLLVPVFPTVYTFNRFLGPDRNFYAKVYAYLKAGTPVTVLGSGSGVDTGLACLKSGRPVVSYDANSLARANVSAMAALNGLDVKVTDQRPRNPIGLVVWNMPAYTPRGLFADKTQKQLKDIWDRDIGGEILRDFARYLAANRVPALIWNESVHQAEIAEIVRAEGLTLRTLGRNVFLLEPGARERAPDMIPANAAPNGAALIRDFALPTDAFQGIRPERLEALAPLLQARLEESRAPAEEFPSILAETSLFLDRAESARARMLAGEALTADDLAARLAIEPAEAAQILDYLGGWDAELTYLKGIHPSQGGKTYFHPLVAPEAVFLTLVIVLAAATGFTAGWMFGALFLAGGFLSVLLSSPWLQRHPKLRKIATGLSGGIQILAGGLLYVTFNPAGLSATGLAVLFMPLLLSRPIHELGHYVIGKFSGLKTLEYSLFRVKIDPRELQRLHLLPKIAFLSAGILAAGLAGILLIALGSVFHLAIISVFGILLTGLALLDFLPAYRGALPLDGLRIYDALASALAEYATQRFLLPLRERRQNRRQPRGPSPEIRTQAVFPLLESLQLTDPKRIPGAKFLDAPPVRGLDVKRLELPPLADPNQPPTGADYLQCQLADPTKGAVRVFDLLYDSRGHLQAVFPVLPETLGPGRAEPVTEKMILDHRLRYLDLSPYWLQVPPLGASGAQARWRAAARAQNRARRAIEAYKQARFPGDLAERLETVPRDFPELDLGFGEETRIVEEELPDIDFLVARVERNTGAVQVKGYALRQLAAADLKPEPGYDYVIAPLYPSVYFPQLAAEQPYYQGISQELDLQPGQRVLVAGPGTGLDVWLAWRQTKNKVYVVGLNPMEIANTRAFAAAAGFEVEAVVGDNIVTADGLPRFAEPFDRVLYNTPFLALGEEEQPTYYEFLEDRWDGDYGGGMLRRFARGLLEVLKPGGQAWIWRSVKHHLQESTACLKTAGRTLDPAVLREGPDLLEVEEKAQGVCRVTRPGADVVDPRPVLAGLLHAAHVRYDLAVRKVVNASQEPKTGLYGGAGADLANFLLSTNARIGYFVARYAGLDVSDLERLADYRGKVNPDYAREKFRKGFASTADVTAKEDILAALAFELEALGVDLDQVRADDDAGHPRIRFEWAYPGAGPETYAVTFLDGDITSLGALDESGRLPAGCPQKLVDVLDGKFDIYYQRAGGQMASGYAQPHNYIHSLYAALSPGGHMITDDYALTGPRRNRVMDFGAQFPLALAEVGLPRAGDLAEDILRVRISLAGVPESLRSLFYTTEKSAPENYYGWHVRIRQKPGATPAASEPGPAGRRGARPAAAPEGPRPLPGTQGPPAEARVAQAGLRALFHGGAFLVLPGLAALLDHAGGLAAAWVRLLTGRRPVSGRLSLTPPPQTRHPGPGVARAIALVTLWALSPGAVYAQGPGGDASVPERFLAVLAASLAFLSILALPFVFMALKERKVKADLLAIEQGAARGDFLPAVKALGQKNETIRGRAREVVAGAGVRALPAMHEMLATRERRIIQTDAFWDSFGRVADQSSIPLLENAYDEMTISARRRFIDDYEISQICRLLHRPWPVHEFELAGRPYTEADYHQDERRLSQLEKRLQATPEQIGTTVGDKPHVDQGGFRTYKTVWESNPEYPAVLRSIRDLQNRMHAFRIELPKLAEIHAMGARRTVLPRIGLKALYLAEMARTGLPVPDGFVIPPDVDVNEPRDGQAILQAAAAFFARHETLIVRSSPEISMPGMLETIGNITTEQELVQAIRQVRLSWSKPEVVEYRKQQGLPMYMDLPVIVQKMAAGDKNQLSGSGVFFTRDPVNGSATPVLRFAVQAKGEAVVGRAPQAPLSQFPERFAWAFDRLRSAGGQLERTFREAVEMEFVIENGELWIVQARPAAMSANARLQSALEMSVEGLVEPATLAAAVGNAMYQPLYRVAPNAELLELGRGLGSAPGAVRGTVVTSLAQAEQARREGKKCILAAWNHPEQIPRALLDGMVVGVVTANGHEALHDSVLARSLGIPVVDQVRGGEQRLKPGTEVILDGTTGRIFAAPAGPNPFLLDSFVEVAGTRFSIRQEQNLNRERYAGRKDYRPLIREHAALTEKYLVRSEGFGTLEILKLSIQAHAAHERIRDLGSQGRKYRSPERIAKDISAAYSPAVKAALEKRRAGLPPLGSDGSPESAGGVLPFVKARWVNRGNPDEAVRAQRAAAYDTRTAWWLENGLLYGVAAVPVLIGILGFGLPALATAGAGYVLVWALFAPLHYLRTRAGRAPPANLRAAWVIAGINLAFAPALLLAPGFLPAIVGASLVTHWGVNHWLGSSRADFGLDSALLQTGVRAVLGRGASLALPGSAALLDNAGGVASAMIRLVAGARPVSGRLTLTLPAQTSHPGPGVALAVAVGRATGATRLGVLSRQWALGRQPEAYLAAWGRAAQYRSALGRELQNENSQVRRLIRRGAGNDLRQMQRQLLTTLADMLRQEPPSEELLAETLDFMQALAPMATMTAGSLGNKAIRLPRLLFAPEMRRELRFWLDYFRNFPDLRLRERRELSPRRRAPRTVGRSA